MYTQQTLFKWGNGRGLGSTEPFAQAGGRRIRGPGPGPGPRWEVEIDPGFHQPPGPTIRRARFRLGTWGVLPPGSGSSQSLCWNPRGPLLSLVFDSWGTIPDPVDSVIEESESRFRFCHGRSPCFSPLLSCRFPLLFLLL